MANEDKLRDYEEAVRIFTESPESLETISPKLDDLIKSIDIDDVIFSVNCIQLIADLASTKHGISYVESKCVPQILVEILKRNDNLTAQHILKFFCRVDPLSLETKYPEVLEKMYDFFQSDDQQLLMIAIDFLGVLGRTGYATRAMLDRHSPLFRQKCLPRLGSILQCSNDDVKVRAIQCLIDLLDMHELEMQQQEESQKLSQTWYGLVIEGEGRMTSQLLSLCRQPFMKIRVNALLLAATIACQPWGQQQLAKDPSFLPWLLNRSTEVTKECKEAKFEILQTLVKSSTASRVFGGENYMKMRADFKNGPFHVGIADEMLIEYQAAK